VRWQGEAGGPGATPLFLAATKSNKMVLHGLSKKLLRVSPQKPLYERKCHARLTREYTDGGANICAENYFATLDNSNLPYSLV
jgi:hypothetical protein